MQEYSETNEGSDLKTLVKLVDDHGTNVLSQAVNSLTSIDNADYVISTAHKAKGLEWGRVQLDDDFYYDVTTNAVKISPEGAALALRCLHARAEQSRHSSYQRLDHRIANGEKGHLWQYLTPLRSIRSRYRPSYRLSFRY